MIAILLTLLLQVFTCDNVARKMTPDELNYLARKFGLSDGVRELNSGPVVKHKPDPLRAADLPRPARKPPVVERAPQYEIAPPYVPEKGNSTRYLVRLTNYRRRLLDEDNLIAKFHIDTLRYCGLLPTDAPGQCKIEVSQKKVPKREDERVEIWIFPPQTWDEATTIEP